MILLPWAATVTLAALTLLYGCIFYVGWARGRYRVKAPATVGHPQFEVAYRIQMNTLENVVLFLPALWLFALYLNELWAAAAGLVWVFARLWYAIAYARNPSTRGGAFVLASLAWGALMLGAVFGVLRALWLA